MSDSGKLVRFGATGRDFSVDLLRCWSCFMVLMGHVDSRLVAGMYGAPGVDFQTPEWYILVFIQCLTRSATPLFVMVSGIFFLSPHRKVTPKKIWAKNIAKLACAYVFWSIAYSAWTLFITDGADAINVRAVLIGSFTEPAHLWYIPMLIILYSVAPFLRLVTAHADKKLYQYGLVLFVLALSVYTLHFAKVLPYYEYIDGIIDRTPAAALSYYTSYFIFGYYLYTYRPGKKVRVFFYVMGAISVIVAFAFYGSISPIGTISWKTGIMAKLTVLTFFRNTAIFLFIVTVFRKFEPTGVARKFLLKLSSATLIIYLAHMMVFGTFSHYGYYEWCGMGPIAAMVVLSVVTYLIGFAAAAVFQLVPWRKMRDGVFAVFERRGNGEA